MTRKVNIGGVIIGGGRPVAIQSMTNTDTADVEASVAQIAALQEAGCEIVRLSAYDIKSAQAFRAIKDQTSIPLVADVHFDYKIAIAAMEAVIPENGEDLIR